MEKEKQINQMIEEFLKEQTRLYQVFEKRLVKILKTAEDNEWY